MKKIFLLSAAIFLVAAGCQQSNRPAGNSTSTPPGGQVACTQEAKRCPDGSYVGRVPPSCEFALCSTLDISGSTTPEELTSGIEGTVKLGPTCPVQRVPSDINCQDKPYVATVEVKTLSGQSVTSFTSNNFGAFKVNLAPGTYKLYPQSGSPLPRATTQDVTVNKDAYTQITIYYDTGIR